MTPEERREANREAQKRYAESHPDEVRARRRAYREANREAINSRQREQREAKRDEALAYQRAWREANRDKVNAQRRARRAANQDKTRTESREYQRKRRQDPDVRKRQSEAQKKYFANLSPEEREKRNAAHRERAKRRLGQNPEVRARTQALQRHGREFDPDAMWAAQAGTCYLCGADLDPTAMTVDHDHRCCPRGKSCAICRRGLACHRCNCLIGLGDDDPAKLRQIADCLEAGIAAVTARMAVPRLIQAELHIGDAEPD